MTLSALGIFSAAGAGGGAASDYELIETQILASATPSITFSSLGTYSSTYKHLQIRTTMRSSRTGFDGDLMGIRLNGDTGNNYSSHILYGSGSIVGSFPNTSVSGMYITYPTAASSTANVFMGGVFDLLDPYSTTKNKTMRMATANGAGTVLVSLQSALWQSTASLTSLTFYSVTSSNFVAGTRISLYGIKG
jgi:hypothetical protein